ncbi:zinc-binding dehydrogenase [Pectobacterium polaris]|uniref:zinc-binding dehydrogenase n=1 Tax=Pectobacterium polaris TaxID=2042057 RepID=UPI000BACC767|nr:zinc-binding dehydrogenase [Pectobacterium polaris]MCA6943212.1 zinc-binding dehydrogenase [Pectobacterium polaris]MCA6956344.1 zinc-binding dehydrogenase [Pectobacterium polaris]
MDECIIFPSGSAHIEPLHALGLDVALDYHQQDVVAHVLPLTQGKGVDSGLDLVSTTLEHSCASLREGGTIVLAGNAGGAPHIDLMALQQANQTLSGLFWGRELARKEARASVDSLLAQARDNKIRVITDRQFALADVVDAHRYAEENSVLGRVILRP